MHVLGIMLNHAAPLVRGNDATDFDLLTVVSIMFLYSQLRGIMVIIVVAILFEFRNNGKHRWAIW